MNLKDIVGITKINHAVEFYYVSLLGKYLKTRGKRLSLKDIDLSELEGNIEKSSYYPYLLYANEQGFFIDSSIEFPIPDGDYFSLEKMFFMGSYDETKPYFYENTENDFYINFRDTGDKYRNMKMFTERTIESACIELTAYFHVTSIFNGNNYRLYPTFNEIIMNMPMGISSAYYLANNPITKNILILPMIQEDHLLHLRYYTWLFLGIDKGLTDTRKEAPLKHKLKELSNKEYSVGNVVFLYERQNSYKTRGARQVVNSMIGVVVDKTDRDITIERVPTNQTRVARTKSFEGYSEGVQELYGADVFSVTTYKETYRYTSIGVGHHMSDNEFDFENYFITPVATKGEVTMWVEQNGFKIEQTMSVKDAVFWVLKEWDIDFDEDLYIETYYCDGQEPLYYQSLFEDDFF